MEQWASPLVSLVYTTLLGPSNPQALRMKGHLDRPPSSLLKKGCGAESMTRHANEKRRLQRCLPLLQHRFRKLSGRESARVPQEVEKHFLSHHWNGEDLGHIDSGLVSIPQAL